MLEIKGAYLQKSEIPKIVAAATGLLIVLGGGLYMIVTHDRGPAVTPIAPNIPASDLLIPPGSESVGLSGNLNNLNNIEVVVNTPTAEATATPTPPPPDPTKPPNREIEQEVQNGILSPKAYAKAEYIQWDDTEEAIGMALKKGEKFTIPETMQVAATARTYQGKPYGYRIVAAREDGSQIIIYGDIFPNLDPEVNIGPVGKKLPAGTVIAETAESGLPVLVGEYTQFIKFTSKEDLKKLFPAQTGNPPKVVINKATPPSQSNNQTGKKGVALFDTPPPQSQ